MPDFFRNKLDLTYGSFLFLLRYVSIRLVPSDHNSIREVYMVKTLKDRSRFVVESIWANGVGVVAANLSA
jgi:hypothetical protein